MKPKTYIHNEPFKLESGGQIDGLEIAYVAEGAWNGPDTKVVWICHALTANADPFDWWSGLVGKGKLYDPDKYFIVCANIIGSCYGTTGPTSLNKQKGTTYLKTFPAITVRDMVQAHIALKKHLGINKIYTLIGGSLGGFQALEWAIMEQGAFENLILLATNAKQSAWGIGIHAAQRLAIENDPAWKNDEVQTYSVGLKLARVIGMLHYRHYDAFQQTQLDEDERISEYKIESYLHYQGDKLGKRFDPFTYWTLTMAMDSQNIGRKRGKLEEVLNKVNAKTLVIGISSDRLCPVEEQEFIANNIPGAQFVEIDSIYGHDGFLIEYERITKVIEGFYKKD